MINVIVKIVTRVQMVYIFTYETQQVNQTDLPARPSVADVSLAQKPSNEKCFHVAKHGSTNRN